MRIIGPIFLATMLALGLVAFGAEAQPSLSVQPGTASVRLWAATPDP